ncbi:HAD domain-containing protein [Paraburkholderia sediminicola]|uniref:HAD domain-containing protein n=1 Tax=Paraburkholderia sediminicola TaxID=458836 RepID=UPI0038B8AACD
MTELDGGSPTALNAPILYVGFSSVLHRGEGLMEASGRVTLDSGRQPFESAHHLSDALAPYPDLQLVLTTSWTRWFGDADTAALLPRELRQKVVGTTREYPPRFGELQNGSGRTWSIIRHAGAHRLNKWLAIGDDFRGVPLDLMSRFFVVPKDTGLETPGMREVLSVWLAKNMSVHPTSSGREQ